MNRILYFLPFGYFVKTRLNTKSAILFHGYAEYLLGVLLLIYSGMDIPQAVFSFAAAYLAFISVYEIGYIFNDFVSVKFEENPRKRLQGWDPSWMVIGVWAAIRIAVFLLLTFLLQQASSLQWWLFYLVLALVFATHNVLKLKEHKIFTFIALAFLRFYAPLFPFLEPALLAQTINGVLLFYVFFRTLTYIDSKGLLHIPSRASLAFKTNYYLISLPLAFIITVISGSPICLGLNIYFLLFWSAFLLAGKLGIMPGGDIKTES